MQYAVIICVALGAVSLYLLSTATANTALFAKYYPTLLAVNGALVVILALLVVYQLVRLGRRLSRQEFGSRLALRFVLMLALMSLLPGALVYAVSVKFLARSIESWFEVRVDKALEGGLSLGRAALDNVLKDVSKRADGIADALSLLEPVEQAAALGRLREQAGLQEAVLFTSRGRIVSYAGNERAGLVPETLSQAALRQARQAQRFAGIESTEERGLYLRVVVPVGSTSLLEDAHTLQVIQPVPAQLAADADTLRTGYRDYQELLLARVGLKRLFGVTLTLSLLIALLSAFLIAFVLSARLAAPLLTLAQGTHSVAQGDFSQRVPVESRDELGVLSASFNTMTEQLAQAKVTTERHEAEINAAKAYLESVLANLSAGVMSFDSAQRLRSVNPSASAILEFRMDGLIGAKLQDFGAASAALSPVAAAIQAGFDQAGAPEWEREVSLSQTGKEKALLFRGASLDADSDAGYVVVFDDISHVIQAQRHAAWSEVARRLAHEIKNPLTPIQLSAERMQLKLSDRLAPAEAEMLNRSTRTIVEQVAALKSMVDAFSQYARSPEPRLQWLDLNQLTREVLGLYESLGRSMDLRLAADLPPVQGDARLLRQVFHNLMQNAQDALADVAEPRIVVVSEDTGRSVRLSIEDNGCGFPEHMMQRVFEPYVTTKQKGTGLGLSIVKKIIEDHGGSVAIENRKPHGARVSIDLPRRAEAGPKMIAALTG
jgi:nitrogen fixation/metabolism regulation signal transduction histidine kinase